MRWNSRQDKVFAIPFDASKSDNCVIEEEHAKWVEVNIWEAEIFMEHQSSEALVATISLGHKCCSTKSSFVNPDVKTSTIANVPSIAKLHEWGENFRFRFTPPDSEAMDSTSQYLFVTLSRRSKLGTENFVGQVCIFIERDLHHKQVTGWFPLLDQYGQRGVKRFASTNALKNAKHSRESMSSISSIGRIHLCISMEVDQ